MTTILEAACPSDLPELQAQRDPDGPCWMFGDRSWTWSEAWDDIRRLAGSLKAAGVSRGDRIAFIDTNHPATLMAMHAVGLIGAADVVLDPRLAGDEIAYILNDASPRIMFVSHQLVPTVEGIRATLGSPPIMVVVGGDDDELEGWISQGEPIGRGADVSLDDAGLVLYSSGTTGRPKGIVLSQRNLMAHTRNAFDGVPSGGDRRMLLGTVMFHSLALFAAATGTPGIIVTDLSVSSLLQALEDGMTHAFLTPTAIRRLHAHGPETQRRFSQLEAVTFTCAPMPRAELDSALEAWPHTRFFHVYGMTEFVGALTMHDDAGRRDADLLGSVGHPIPGVELRLVDPHSGRDVAPGASGELWFRTGQATPGYLGRAEATAELLGPDGWGRTGDIGHLDDAGRLFVEDRIKDVIIINGYNVHSSEVERVLDDHPAVSECAVIGVPDRIVGESVKALVVLRPQAHTTSDDLITFVRERLAEHKTPTTIDLVASLPRTTSGKILKRELRDPYWAGRELQI